MAGFPLCKFFEKFRLFCSKSDDSMRQQARRVNCGIVPLGVPDERENKFEFEMR